MVNTGSAYTKNHGKLTIRIVPQPFRKERWSEFGDVTPHFSISGAGNR
jgi:hypothetical protein